MLVRRSGIPLALALGLCAVLAALRPLSPAPEASSAQEAFRRLLLEGRKAAPLAPETIAQKEVGPLRIERVRFTPEPGADAIALVQRPAAEGRYPAVIVQHFLGGSKDHVAMTLPMGLLAQAGFLVAAIDGRYRGERQNGKTLEAAMLEALRTGRGRPFLIDTAYDVLRLVDYLQSRPDVDPERIGMTGFSEGGILTWMCAAADERIRAAVPVIGVTCFADAFREEDGPQVRERLRLFEPVLKEYARDLGEPEVTPRVLRAAFDRLVPGLTDRFDAPNMVPLIAPRPLLILCHEQDELFPLAGARKVEAAARERYRALGAEDRFDFRVAPGLKHGAFHPLELPGIVQWMERWLRPRADRAALPRRERRAKAKPFRRGRVSAELGYNPFGSGTHAPA